MTNITDESGEDAGRFIVLMPDRRDILFVREGEIVRHNLETGVERVLRGRTRYTYRLAVSPDGSQLAYFEGDSRSEEGWHSDLIVMSLKDGSTRTLWSGTKDRYFSRRPGLEWMPDDKHLLLAISSDEGQQLYLVDVNSGEQQPVGPATKGNERIQYISIHPNGKTIAFSRGGSAREIWAMENFLPEFEAAR
jgi:Tol biopolymer transport system component